MSTRPPCDDALDRIARELHETAVGHVAPSTLRRLHPRPVAGNRHRPGARSPIPGWAAVASACAVVVALVAVLALPGRLPDGALEAADDATPLSVSTPSTGSLDAGSAILDEDPDFYLWLATTDVQPLAME